jgi:aspartate aminotransferase
VARKNHEPEVNLNLNVRGLPVSATVGINEKSDQMIRDGKKVYKLGLGESPFPVPETVVRELRSEAHRKKYLPVRGLFRLRRAVAEYHRRSQGLTTTFNDILVGPGSKELMFLLQLVYYGDLVIPTPAWVSYAPQAEIVGRKVHWLETRAEHDWRLMPDELAQFCSRDPSRPRIVILNYPSNPTGCTYSLERLKELAKVAREYRVVLLSDEIYGELHHRGQHVSIARFYPEGTIVSTGLSKWCGAGGWRLGVFAFPPEMAWLSDAMASVASETFTSTSSPIQYAAVRAFEGGTEIERYLVYSRRILRSLGRWGVKCLREVGAEVSSPKGAFYLFPDFSPLREKLAARGIRTSRELCDRLLDETGVAILPGSAFGHDPERLTARVAYVDFDGARALAAAEHAGHDNGVDEGFLRGYCGPVLEAFERMCGWLGPE